MTVSVLLAVLALPALAGGQKSAPAPTKAGPFSAPTSSPVLTRLPSLPGLGSFQAPGAEVPSLPAVNVSAFGEGSASAPRGAATLGRLYTDPSRDGSVDKSPSISGLKLHAAQSAAQAAAPTAAAQAAGAAAPLTQGAVAEGGESEEEASMTARAAFDGEKKDDSAPAVRFTGEADARASALSKPGRRALGGLALAFGAGAPVAVETLGASGDAGSPVAWAAAALGLALGMRHALDPDHVVAMLNMLSGQKSKWKGWRSGALWGLGHSAALLVVGGALILAKAAVPVPLAAGLESLVALMLVGLGLKSIFTERYFAKHGHYHDLDAIFKRGLRPFFIGLVHGLAGSGAVALLAAAAVPGAAAGFLYLGMFGLGTIAGMTLVTFFLQALSGRLFSDPKVRGRVAMAAGALSALFGAYMLFELVPLILGS